MQGSALCLDEFSSFSRLAKQGHAAPLVSVAECKSYEHDLIASGCSALDLMEQAAIGIKQQLKEKLAPALASNALVILCGSGNNGGDGLALARLLAAEGIFARLVLINSDKYSTECVAQIKKLPAELSLQVFPTGDNTVLNQLQLRYKSLGPEEFCELVTKADILIDALLGIGQLSEPRGAVAELLSLLDTRGASNCCRVALDVPTGINCDTGQVFKGAFASDLCICIGAIKRGLSQYPARALVKKLSLVELGSSQLQPQTDFFVSTISEQEKQILKRPEDAHKGVFGRIAIIGGSPNFPGAPVLSANAAVLSGAGLVTKFHLSAWPIPGLMPEVMLKNSKFSSNPELGPEHLDEALQLSAASDAVVIGPGLGQSQSATDFLSSFLARVRNTALVVDADALNLIASNSLDLPKLERLVLTPHPGEAARLLGTTVEAIEHDRFTAVRTLQGRYGGTVLLKGASSIICASDYGSGLVNLTGSSYLATGGSGDRLSGMIAALLARGLDALSATKIAVFAHGALAEKIIDRPWF
jgi:hydroxyethylthiazole kinase-like uncharacterized protein yjeF